MYNKHIEDFVVSYNDSIYKAVWKYHKSPKILVVLDNQEKFLGVLTKKEIMRTYFNENASLEDIVNKKCKVIYDYGNSEDVYADARALFLDNVNINYIPVIDKDKNVLNIFSRQKAFWMQYYVENKLPRMHYATGIYKSAYEAKNLGYKKFSVMEFGVAGGSGLINLEFHAKEISRLFDIDIEVYGFDLGTGLPGDNQGYKDKLHIWQEGFFLMDQNVLKNKLQGAKLVLGNIADTVKTFINDYTPAPVGFVAIDVDYYSSTVPILNFLKSENDEYFLPRIWLYCDDVNLMNEFQGEELAIKEFNNANKDFKVSPEHAVSKVKLFHRFKHGKYDKLLPYSAMQLPCKMTI